MRQARPPGREDNMRNAPGERRRWCPRHGRHCGAAARASAAATDASRSAGGTVQLAIGLLTASLDSPELLAWAAGALVPQDPAALGHLLPRLPLGSDLLPPWLH